MTAFPLKRKGKESELKAVVVSMTDEEKEAAEKKKRSFERSLAGPSVGKAGEFDGWVWM